MSHRRPELPLLTSYPYQVALSYILTALIVALIVLAAECTGTPAHASQWSLDLKGGLAVPIRTTPDGTYWQQAFEHKTRTVTTAWAAGLSYQVNPAWSLQAHYLDLGSSKIKGLAVADSDYGYKQHRCMASVATCSTPYYFKATDSLRGGDLTATYTWRGAGLEPFVKAGVAVLQHHAVFQNANGAADTFRGILPELEVGVGVKYQWAYLELDYFQGLNFGGQNLPISTQQVAMFAGVNIPL